MPTTGNGPPPGMLDVQEQILRSIPDVVLRYDRDGVLDWASPSLEHVFGYRPADVVGTRFRMSSGEVLEQLDAAFHAMVDARDRHMSQRFPLNRANGTTTWVEMAVRSEYEADGVSYMVAVIRELADRGDPEQLYRILAHTTSDVVFVYDPQSVILWASPSVAKVLGHDPRDLIGSSQFVVHPEDLDAAMDLYRQAIADKAPTLRNRARLLCADGSSKWMDASITLVWSDAGELQYEIVSLRDVDAEVAAEQELRQSLARFQMLVDNSHDVLYQFGGDGRLAWITPNVAAMIGWEPAELIGMYRLDFVHPDDVAVAQRARDEAASGHPATVEVRMRTKDGGYRWIEASAGVTRDAHGAIAGVGVLRDIQGRHDAQKALADSEQLFRSAMRDSAVGMCLITPEGRITDANQALCDFLGRPLQELTSLTWPEVADPTEVPADLVRLADLVSGEVESMRGIRHYFRPDGSSIVGDLTVSALRNDDEGQVERLLVQIVDVTEANRLQEQLAASEEHYRLLADSVSDVVVRSDNQGIILWVSKSVTPATGWAVEDLIGRLCLEIAHPNDIEMAQQAYAAVAKGGTQHLEIRILTADDNYRWFAIALNPVLGADGAVSGRVAAWRDISGEIATRRLLAEREAEFREIAEHAADVVLRMDADDNITWASPSAMAVLGYLNRDYVGLDPKLFVHPGDLREFHDFAHNLHPNMPGRLTVRVRCADGEYRWFAVIATRVVGPDGKLVSQIVGMRNIDGEVRAVEALARSEEQFRQAMQSAPSGMAVVDLEDNLVQVNDSLARMVDHPRDWLLRHALRDVIHPQDWPGVQRLIEQLVQADLPPAMEEIRLVAADGSTVWVQSSLAALRDADGSLHSLVVQVVDVTQAREAREALHHAAHHDPLTSLGNRRGLSESLERALSRIPRTGTRIAVLALDLDGLKPVNDQHGHSAGDEVLVTVGNRLRAAVRKDDPIARVGGDEFVIVLVAVHNAQQVMDIAEKIRESVSREIPLTGGRGVRITASIGGVLAGSGEDAAGLLRRADAALYRAKHNGRDQVVIEP